ncbi:MAG TPA: hypothetical protein VHD87_14985 [Acidimicrobiales bacterium]|nr:hypothetical protein [Acidimicrobiales bacterium]
MAATLSPELRQACKAAGVTDRRVLSALAEAGVTSVAEAATVLEHAAREVNAQRRLARERAAQAPVVAAAVRRAQNQVVLRTSPDLARAQERGERLRRRMHAARQQADQHVLWLYRITGFLDAKGSAVTSDAAVVPDTAPAGEVMWAPAVNKLNAAVESFKQARGITDEMLERHGAEVDDGEG